VDVTSAKHDDVVDLINKSGEFLTLTVISSDNTRHRHHGNIDRLAESANEITSEASLTDV